MKRNDPFDCLGFKGPSAVLPIVVVVVATGLWVLVEQLHIYLDLNRQGARTDTFITRGIDDTKGPPLLYFRPVDINQASLEELTAIRGIGYKTALRILEFKNANGFLLTIEELDTVGGPVRPSRLGAIVPYLSAE